jgi:hypothetical protein
MRLVQFNGWVGPQLLSAYAPLWTCSVSHKIIALTAASFCRFNGRFFAVGSRPTNPMIKPAGASCSRKGRLADHLSSQAARQLWPPRVRHRQACRRLQEGLARRSRPTRKESRKALQRIDDQERCDLVRYRRFGFISLLTCTIYSAPIGSSPLVLIAGLSCKTMFNKELWTSSFPLYSIKPNLRNLFMKKLTRDRVVPIISASIS